MKCIVCGEKFEQWHGDSENEVCVMCYEDVDYLEWLIRETEEDREEAQ